MRCAAFVLALAGCGFRFAGGSGTDAGSGSDDATIDEDAPLGDAPLDDGPPLPPDAPGDGPVPSCLARWIAHTIAFETPTAITPVNSTSYERDPFLSPDELTIWFSTGGPDSLGGGDVFVSKRASRAQPFNTPSRDASFSTSGGAESKVSITLDGLYAVFASSQGGGAGAMDIWETTRPNTTANWGAITRTHVMSLATANSEHDPFVTPDGLHLYYAPDSPAPQHIVVASRALMSSNFGNVQTVGGIDNGSPNGDPTLFANDRIIVFYSGRASTRAGGNIWYATRGAASDAFGAPVELVSVNTDSDEGDPHVSPDGCRIYFGRNVGGGVDWELFSANAQ